MILFCFVNLVHGFAKMLVRLVILDATLVLWYTSTTTSTLISYEIQDILAKVHIDINTDIEYTE